MSFISNLLGGQQQAPQAVAGTQQDYQNALNNQNSNIAQLQQQAAGNGPSASKQILQNATSQNTAGANALAASQRGINPGLALRNATESASANNQAAAGQAVAGRQQEMLNAQQQLGGAINTQAGQILQGSQANAGINAQVGAGNAGRSQSSAGGLLGGIGSVLGLADGGMVPMNYAKGGAVLRKLFADGGDIPAPLSVNLPSGDSGGGSSGGGGGGASSITKMLPMLLAADGGYIPPAVNVNLPQGTDANPFAGMFGNGKKAPAAAPSGPQATGLATAAPGDRPVSPGDAAMGPPTAANAGPQSFIGKSISNLGNGLATSANKIGSSLSNAAQSVAAEPGKMGADLQKLFAAKGGQVPAMVSPGERYLNPDQVKEVISKGKNPMKAGEKIPGKANVGGAKNSYANDTVPKKLESGGIVLPRSITQSDDAPAKAAAFVKAIQAKKAKRGNA